MSRHVIPSPEGFPKNRSIVVGWDAPLNTFFAQVLEVPPGCDPDDTDEVFALGDTACELPTIGDLARALDRNGIALPVEVATRLGEDHQQEGKQFVGRPAAGLLAAMADTYAGPAQQARISAALTGQDQAGEGR